jgi:hypothetical protein
MRKISFAATLFVLTLLGSNKHAVASDVCDRACLESHVNRYIAAMIAHNPSELPLARDVRFTENGQELRLGDGLWATASAPGKYKLYVTDPKSGQIGFYGTIFENGTPVLLALRLKVDEQLITEIETIIARSQTGSNLPGAGAAVEKRVQPRPQFLQTVPASERMPRQRLVEVANSYFTGLANNTGRNTAPFAPTCERVENGTQTTHNPAAGKDRNGFNVLGLGCEEQQKSGFYSFVTSIRNRRFPIVDEERGLVMAFGFFEHTGAVRTVTISTGQTFPAPFLSPLTFQISELFQIRNGKIDQIEAVLNTVPYGMRSDAWDR